MSKANISEGTDSVKNKVNYAEKGLKLYKDNKGVFEVVSKVKLETRDDLSTAYTPGVAEPCLRIKADSESVYDYTSKGNYVAVITDGSAVLGLGDIGPLAGLPVMEGKSILFKEFGDINAIPILVNTKDVDEFVETVKNISISFGGINLEDISAPRCFEIEERLKKECDIPIMHDDQHGTAIVALAGLINALKIVKKNPSEIKVVLSGAGAAGIAITKLFLHFGVENLILVDTKGVIYHGRKEGMNTIKDEIAKITNPENLTGDLKDVIKDADVFVGISAPGLLTKEMIRTMHNDAIIFALANPMPEILPDEAKAGGARIIATGRSDFPNQVNNALAFPGVFRGALDVRAREINEEMKLAAACALACYIKDDELNEENIIPKVLDKNVAKAVAKAVREAAIETKVARKFFDKVYNIHY